jgi:hypothetical protein
MNLTYTGKLDYFSNFRYYIKEPGLKRQQQKKKKKTK